MKNNPVKKNMDKFHKPKTHRDKTKYSRKDFTLKELNKKINEEGGEKRKWNKKQMNILSAFVENIT